LSLQARRNGAHLCLRLPPGYARFEARHHTQVMIASACRLIRPKGHRRPELLFTSGEAEMRGHNADDRVRMIVERQALPNNASIAAEAPLPQAMTEHDYALGVGAVFLLRKDAPQRRRDAEQREQAGRNTYALDPLRLATPGQAQARAPEGGDLREDSILIAPVNEIRRRYVVVREAELRRSLPHHHEFVRILIRQRPQQRRVRHAKDGRVRADAERQRNHRNQCEARVLQ
jgi:hypothetical protein